MNSEKKPNRSGINAPSWLEKNVNGIMIGLVVACVLSVVADPLIGLGYDDHHPPHFAEESWTGFCAIFGFVVFVAVVFLGRGLRFIVQRQENYYDRD